MFVEVLVINSKTCTLYAYEYIVQVHRTLYPYITQCTHCVTFNKINILQYIIIILIHTVDLKSQIV